MKKYLLSVIIFIAFIMMSCSKNETPAKFSFFPETPKVGEEIIFKYIPDSEKLKNVKSLDMIIYSYSNNLLDTKKVGLEKDGNEWLGKFTTEPKTKGLIIKFVSGDIVDNNNEMGYVIHMYDQTEVEVLGSEAGLANVYVNYAGAMDLKNDKELALKYFTEVFSKHPELKKEFLDGYFKSLPNDIRDSVVILNLLRLEEKDSLTQSDLETLTTWSKQIGDLVKSEKYLEILENRFPKSELVESKYYTMFKNKSSLDKKLEVFHKFVQLNKESRISSYMLRNITSDMVENNQLHKAKKMLNEYSELANSSLYNSISWDLYQSKKNLKQAAKFAEEGIRLARSEVEDPKGKRPVYMDLEEWIQQKKNSLGMILDTYGSIEKELGNEKVALKSFEEAVDLTNSEFIDIDENYVSELYDLKQNKKVKEKIEEFISMRKSSDKMRNLLSNAFMNLGGTKEELGKYLDKLDTEANKKLDENLKNEIINKPAPAFSLKDLEGNNVSLSDYRGKTVIVDFWATWCGPCRQSFPFMKKAVEEYSDNPNVNFLFINTWEKVDNKVKNAKDFILKNNYPFHVLVDQNDEVISKYNVPGIPTKFIIDKNGNIRFKVVGFEGSEKENLNEINKMIAMVK